MHPQTITTATAVAGLILTTGAAGHPSLAGLALQGAVGLGLLFIAAKRAQREEANQ